MNTRPQTLTPVKREILSASEFLRLSQKDTHRIERSRFVPPRIGETNFGRFEVIYRTPVMRPLAW